MGTGGGESGTALPPCFWLSPLRSKNHRRPVSGTHFHFKMTAIIHRRMERSLASLQCDSRLEAALLDRHCCKNARQCGRPTSKEPAWCAKGKNIQEDLRLPVKYGYYQKPLKSQVFGAVSLQPDLAGHRRWNRETTRHASAANIQQNSMKAEIIFTFRCKETRKLLEPLLGFSVGHISDNLFFRQIQSNIRWVFCVSKY